MCGGAEKPKPTLEPKQDFTYAPPDLKSLYETFRETGTVPYSYYGVNAPTREGELDAMKKSYPGAFTAASAPQIQDPRQQQHSNPLTSLFSALGRRGR